LVFFDRASGSEHFEVEAARDGTLAFDQAACLVAIAPQEGLLEPVLPVARKLVNSGGENRLPIDSAAASRKSCAPSCKTRATRKSPSSPTFPSEA
jgi:hypothetical protein